MFKVGEIALTQGCKRHPNNVEVEIIPTPKGIQMKGIYGILFDGVNYLIEEKILKNFRHQILLILGGIVFGSRLQLLHDVNINTVLGQYLWKATLKH